MNYKTGRHSFKQHHIKTLRAIKPVPGRGTIFPSKSPNRLMGVVYKIKRVRMRIHAVLVRRMPIKTTPR